MMRNIANERQLHIAQRWQEYAAERRANGLRVIAIGLFYSIHLLHYWLSRGQLPALGFLQLGDTGPVASTFHTSVTLLALAWTMLCLGTMLCLNRRFFPWWLKFVSTGTDLFFLTAVLYLGLGPRSPLVVGYFLVISTAALRMNLSLVRFAMFGSISGYLCLLGSAKWPATFGKGGEDISVPRYEQMIVLLAVVLLSVILGQMIRAVRCMAKELSPLATTGGDD